MNTQRVTHYIDGEQREGSAWIDNIDPATGAVYGQIAEASAEDVNSAVHAAARAFPAWAGLSAMERGEYLIRMADLLDARRDEMARAESIDTGKPIELAMRVDIPRGAANLRYFAHAVQHSAGESYDFDGAGTPGGARAINVTLRSPRGVAGCISPWNLPLYLFTWKIAPALATGNTVVAKPSEVTPVTAYLLGCIAHEVGLPRGVLNIVHGRGAEAGAAVVSHPLVPTITFTGSTAVGRWIGERCGGMLKRMSLELGGKNPFIIFEDADPEQAATLAARAAFTNQGQICLCGSRLIVHELIAERVIQGVVAAAQQLVVGDPLDPATQFGALVSEAHLAKVQGCVDDARRLGGRVLCGGARVDPDLLPARVRDGAYFAPTVISGLDPGCSVEREEIFGPVVTVQTFKSDEEALQLANGTDYGLAAIVMTNNLARSQRMMRALNAGIVWVNCWMVRDLRTPFGGMKQSGVGREGGMEAIRFFTESKNVCVLG
jgi:aminomuconate-semialdehyde/2-hydroxymuconate-6-semialdehyde dehydrogenase